MVQAVRGDGGKGFRWPDQGRDLSGEPAGADSPRDRGRAVRCDPGLYRPAGVFGWTRSSLRSAVRPGSDRRHGARHPRQRRCRAAKDDVRLGRQQGYPWRRIVGLAAVLIVASKPIRHLDDIKGKKLRVLAADMQQEMLKRLGASPVAMTLGDVLPAIQQGAIDGAVLALTVDATMRYYYDDKETTETNQPFIFSMAFLSKKWFDALPGDLQKILDTDAGKAAAEVNPWEADFFKTEAEVWKQHGEIISLPAAEQAEMIQMLQGVGADVAKSSPELEQAYNVFVAAAKRTK